MLWLKTVLLFFLVGLSFLILMPLGLILFVVNFLGFKKFTASMIGLIAQAWGLTFIFLTGCNLKITGKENIPEKGGVCFVSNHGSIFDIVLLLASAGRPLGFVAKKELGFIPILNLWILLIGGLFIDRSNIRKSLRTIKTGVKHIQGGGSMLIFPEGHRSKGQGLLPFHPGSFKLATQSGAPIVPVAITGSYEVFEKTHRVHAVPVRVVFLAPINTSELSAGDRRQTLSDQVRAVMSDALAASAEELAEWQKRRTPK
ncbi:MAG: 1-acyl-sn-glycerol-3-phosphate acyltransferase [Treponema sp.]|jgi:1-acyl-sn-glycerol-3-phosphate acyltransferase|nr:1-acyl-sn-glycerol-3-phosphate acyltransferase [Treponema sp.]